MDLLLITSQLLNALLLVSVGVRISAMFHNPSMLKNLILCVGSFAAGIGVTQYLATYASAFGAEATIMCRPMDGGLWYDCMGWPVVFDSVAQAVNALGEVFGVGMKLPALTAQILGSLYIHRRLTSNFLLDHVEILKAFFGGCILYSSLIWLPVPISMATNTLTEMMNIQGMVTSGREVLSGTLRAIKSYQDLADDQHSISDTLRVLFLQAMIYTPGLVLSIIGLLSIFAQNVALAFLPFYAFSSLMSRHPDYMIAIKVAVSYIGFVAFQVILWIVIGMYPGSFKTGDISEIGLADAAAALRPVFVVTLIIILIAKYPSQWLTSTMKTLTLVRIK